MKGGVEVTKELGEQSKKLITKKYGDEVINVFTAHTDETKESAGGEGAGAGAGETAPEAHAEAEDSVARLDEPSQ